MPGLIMVGFLVVAITIAIHGAGMSLCLWFLLRNFSHPERRLSARERLRLFIITPLALMLVHLVEALVWATTFLHLPADAPFESFEEALYFSLVTFTTLGYGDITLDPGVRLLSGFAAMNGILLFGASTAFFFSVLQRAWGASAGSEIDSVTR